MDDLDTFIEGSIELPRDVRFYGAITGNWIVPSGHRLELFGTVGRNLVVEEGATAVVYGIVHGTLVNNGGTVLVEGGSVPRVENRHNVEAPGSEVSRTSWKVRS